MITYHNTGGGGKDYSRLEITQAGSNGIVLELICFDHSVDIQFNWDQIVHLRDALSKYIEDEGTEDDSFIEGEEI